MRLHLDNVAFGARTGPNVFGTRLAQELVLQGHEIELEDGRNADASIVFIEPSGARLSRRTVQRLDGIWSKPNDITRLNHGMRALYEHADGVVFQSNFDKTYITTHWGVPPKDAVIRNGIAIDRIDDLSRVEPGLARLRDEYTNIFVCSSNWRRCKRLRENVQLFRNLQVHHPNSALIIMGADPDVNVADPHIYYTGSMPEALCMQVFAISDWMLHLAYFDHCPNTVVEALSQDVAVVCTDVGGTAELVGGHGVVLHEPTPFRFDAPCDYDEPPPLDLGLSAGLPHRSVLPPAVTFDIAHTARQYVEFIETL